MSGKRSWVKSMDGARLVVGCRELACVIRNDDGTWRWIRSTSIAEDGIALGYGVEPDKYSAMRRAAEWILPVGTN